MDTMRKCCKDELPKGCPECQKEDIFGDVCHAYQAYQQGRADAIEECIWKITNEHTHSCYNDDVYEAVRLLEQLKEQKNE